MMENAKISVIIPAKNERRQKILEALSEHPRSLKGLQEYLKSKGNYHSQQTISKGYIEPLIKIGLVKKDGIKYRLTLYGQKFLDISNRFNIRNPLPSNSNCYEESLLKDLKMGPKSYADLIFTATPKSLSRSLRRLTKNGLVKKSEDPNYVFYFKTKKIPKKEFSPTEKRIYEVIPEAGISARKLSQKVGINLRRTYKYLRRLRKRRLVFTRKKSKTYELTTLGTRLTNFLEETEKLITETTKASACLIKNSVTFIETPTPLES